MIAKYEKLSENIGDEGARARDKELIGGIKVIDISHNATTMIRNSPYVSYLQDIVDCRLYMGRSSTASTVYCNIWVHGLKFGGGTIHGAASGKAGGYGYDKKSAAVGSALDNLGINLYQDDGIKPVSINGVGDTAIREALLAVAVALGYSADTLIYVECYA